VFCAEWVDSPDKHVRNLILKDSAKLRAAFEPDKLNGVEAIRGEAAAYHFERDGRVAHSDEGFTAIPYYAWANRGAGQMEVWIADKADVARPTPYRTLASTSQVTVSGSTEAANGARSPRQVADQEDPASSADATSEYNWWPRKGTTEWIQYDFQEAHAISSTDVYWFAEKDGEVAAPAGWRLLYLRGTEWTPVEADEFGLVLDQYNHVSFKSVTTKAVRLEVKLAAGKSAGVSEWKIQ
jgi:hypothetical protein